MGVATVRSGSLEAKPLLSLVVEDPASALVRPSAESLPSGAPAASISSAPADTPSAAKPAYPEAMQGFLNPGSNLGQVPPLSKSVAARS